MFLFQGAQEMFKELPHVFVEPHELKYAAEKYGIHEVSVFKLRFLIQNIVVNLI